MKIRYIFVIIFLCFFIFVTYVISKYDEFNIESAKQTISQSNNNYDIKNFKEDTEKYNIDVYYPGTEYNVLNDSIQTEIQIIVDDFKRSANTEHDNKYTLKISFNYYEYQDLMSFAFNLFIDTGGAHPGNRTFTINYDKNTNIIVDIIELTKRYKDVISVFSNLSYESLKNNEKILKYGNDEMFSNGLKEDVKNFQNFVFDKNSIVIFFNEYDIAPYVAGSFIVRIPYDKLDEIKK